MPRKSSTLLLRSFVFIATFALLTIGYFYLPEAVWAGPAETQAATPWQPPSPGFRVIIGPDRHEGLFQLDYNYLSAAGLPVDTLDPRTFRMFWMGNEIAIQVTGESDGQFNTDDRILFYGRNLDELFYDELLPTNKYTGDNVFWLTYGGINGKRMLEIDAAPGSNVATTFPHSIHLEKNLAYLPQSPDSSSADHWFWQNIQAIANTSCTKTYTFSAANIATGTFSGSLTVTLVSKIDGKTHDLALAVNNHQVYHDDTSWVGATLFTATATVPQSYFQEGTNSVNITVTNHITAGGAVDEVYPDWIEITYYDTYTAEDDQLIAQNGNTTIRQYQIGQFVSDAPAVYNISDLANVKRLKNAAMSGSGPYTIAVDSTAAPLLAVSPTAWQVPTRIEPVIYPASSYTLANLLDTSNAADYIIITHHDFWAPAEELATYRANDYTVALIDARQIYDQFNGGMMSAEAIHDFLSYAYHYWTTRPEYVLLIGDGTYDMRNYEGNSFNTYIPISLRIIGRITGETAADNRFVTLEDDATYDDLLADMYLGRFPVNTVIQAQAMVSKTIAYETALCNPLPTDVLFVADDENSNLYWHYSDDVADGYADEPANTIKYLPFPYTPIKKYLGSTCDYADDGNASSAEECNQQIIDKLNDTGALLVAYSGHATQNLWAMEHIWDEASVAALTNTTACQLPIMITLACNEGYFHDPVDSAVSEVGVRQTASGPVASISATYYGFPQGHDALEKEFFLAIFHDHIHELGKALLQAKQYALDNNYRTEADGYMLMGDPALKIRTGALALESEITITNNRIQLFWNNPEGAVRYDVYRAIDNPYFHPTGSPYAQNAIPSWMDYASGSLGDPNHNYFYLVQAIDALGNTSNAPHLGEFDFALTPGD
jgi:hypothetical protein